MTEYSENNNNVDEEEEKRICLNENICAPLVTLEFILTSKKNSEPKEMNEPFLTNQTRKWKAKEKENTIYIHRVVQMYA